MKSHVLLSILFLSINFYSQMANAQKVIVNGKTLSSKTVQTLEFYYKIKIQNGRYWYDRKSGLWGIEGQPARGIILTGMNLGGSLKADASAGKSGVFINGREITRFELGELVKITQTYIPPGRYWLDEKGYAGPVGQRATANLFKIAARYYGQNNQTSFYRNRYTGIGSGNSGGTFYVIGKDFSYTH